MLSPPPMQAVIPYQGIIPVKEFDTLKLYLENIGANTPDLNFFKSRFCSGLGMYIEIFRKDMVGTLAEWAYSTIVNKPWLKRRIVSYID